MLDLLPESAFVLVVILLVMLVLHALATMAALACRLVYASNSDNCFVPATSSLTKIFALGSADGAACSPLGKSNQGLRHEDQVASIRLDSKSRAAYRLRALQLRPRTWRRAATSRAINRPGL